MDDNDKKILLYNSKLIRNYVNLIRLKYPAIVNVEELLKYADISSTQVDDDSVWFSQTQINRFYEKLVAVTGNQDIAYDAGKYTVSPQAIGVLEYFFLSFGTPEKALERIVNTANQLTRSADYSLIKVGHNQVKITVKLKKGIKEEDFQCRNRIGYFAGVFKLFGLKKPPEIIHDKCMFNNGWNICEYFIKWEDSKSWINILKDSIYNNYFKQWLNPKYENLYEDLYNEIDTNYSLTLMIKEISEILIIQNNINDLFTQIMNILKQRLRYKRGLIMLSNQEQTKLIYKSGFGYTVTPKKILQEFNGLYVDKLSKAPFIRSFLDRKPIYLRGITNRFKFMFKSLSIWYYPIDIWSTLTVNPGVTLSIRLGNVISSRSSLNIKEILNIEGTKDTPIIFTSDNEDKAAGNWGNIKFENGSTTQKFTLSSLQYKECKMIIVIRDVIFDI